jgi:hypothetical protein
LSGFHAEPQGKSVYFFHQETQSRFLTTEGTELTEKERKMYIFNFSLLPLGALCDLCGFFLQNYRDFMIFFMDEKNKRFRPG